jgi:hypothetical protein
MLIYFFFTFKFNCLFIFLLRLSYIQNFGKYKFNLTLHNNKYERTLKDKLHKLHSNKNKLHKLKDFNLQNINLTLI